MWRWALWSQNGRGPHAHAPGAPVVPKAGGSHAPSAVASVVRNGRRPPRPCGRGSVGLKTKGGHLPMWRGPRWSEKRGRPRAHAVGGLSGPKTEEVPSPMRRGPDGPKTEKALTPMRWRPRWSQHGGGPRAHVAGASVVPKWRSTPRPCGGGHQWSQNGGGPLAHAAGASLVPKRRRPPCPCGGGFGGPKTEEAPRACGGGLRRPQIKEHPTPMRQRLGWSQG